MRTLRRILSNSSGQVLLFAVALGGILLLALTVGFFVTQLGALHQTASAQRSRTRAVAEEGITYAAQQVAASTTVWQNALSANFANTDCNTGNAVISPSGS